MPSLRLPIVINREIDAALKRVADSTQIPAAVLARNAIIAMLAEHGEIIQNVPRPGGNRHVTNVPPLAEIEPTKGKVEQDTPADSEIEQDKPSDIRIEQNEPADLSPDDILRKRRLAASGKGLLGNGKR